MAQTEIREICAADPSPAGRVLIADDQKHILAALQLLLKSCGFATEAVTCPEHVLQLVQAEEFDAVLMDLNYTRDTTGGGEGLELDHFQSFYKA